MYSGGDSSGDDVNSRNQFNWQITSQTSCNVNSGGVIDWASLAQQWIQMKDSGAGLPDTPPPPVISANSKSSKITKFDEQGEADMEVEKDDEQQIVGFGQTVAPPQIENLNTGRWFPPQDTVPYCAPQQNQWTSWSNRVTLPPPALLVPITTGSLTPPIPKEIVPSTTPPLKSIPHLPKHPSEVTTMLPSKESLELPPMDAAKRKILPAWIREGLEKMEREKLKQLERVQKDKEPSIAGTPPADSDINNKIKTMVKNSIIEMEGESSGNEAAVSTKSPAPYDVDTDRAVASATPQLLTSVPEERIVNSLSGKTYEERMTDMMIAVRKTLTELLLEVTNEEISSIAYEAIRKRRAKASSAQVIRKSAITSITGKLGLEAYADSDTDNSASDNDTNNDESKRSDDEIDSEEELKANIRICKRAFAKTVEEIEERVQAAAAREETLLRERQKRNSKDQAADTRRSPLQKSKGFDKEIGEPQPDKKSNSNGKRRKERTSRFSDNKDSRNRNATNYFPAPSINSGNLSSQAVPGSSGSAPTSLPTAKYKVANAPAGSSLAAPLPNDKRSTSSSYSANKLSKPTPTSTSSTTSKHHRHSESPSNSSDSTSSGTRSSHSRRSKYSASRHKRSSTERSKRSHCRSSYRSSRRRDSSDSNDNDHYKKRRQPSTTTSSSVYSRRHNRRRSDSRSSRSRTRSRSRSRSTTYSSSRRTDRY